MVKFVESKSGKIRESHVPKITKESSKKSNLRVCICVIIAAAAVYLLSDQHMNFQNQTLTSVKSTKLKKIPRTEMIIKYIDFHGQAPERILVEYCDKTKLGGDTRDSLIILKRSPLVKFGAPTRITLPKSLCVSKITTQTHYLKFQTPSIMKLRCSNNKLKYQKMLKTKITNTFFFQKPQIIKEKEIRKLTAAKQRQENELMRILAENNYFKKKTSANMEQKMTWMKILKTKDDPKGSIKSDPKGSIKSDPKGRIKSDPKGSIKSETENEAESESESEAESETESEAESETESEAEREEKIEGEKFYTKYMSGVRNFLRF